jgi:hypothetical protein
MIIIADARAKPYCISVQYEKVKKLIGFKFGFDHHLYEELVQEAAIGYQRWLATLDLDKFPAPFNSCMKKAYWCAYDYLRKQGLRECLSVGDISSMDESDLGYYLHDLDTSDVESAVHQERLCNQLAQSMDSFSVQDQQRIAQEYFEHNGLKTTTVSKYKKNKFKNWIATCVMESL